MAFHQDPSDILDAILEIAYESIVTKKRVFNKIKMALQIEGENKEHTIFITIASEPPAFGGSIYLGEDILIREEDRFTTSVIEQIKQIEAYNERDEGAIQ